MYLSKLQNAFVQIAKCIWPNCKMYLSHWNAGLLLFASLNRRHSESKLLFSFKSFQEKIRWELKADVGARDDEWLFSLEFVENCNLTYQQQFWWTQFQLTVCRNRSWIILSSTCHPLHLSLCQNCAKFASNGEWFYMSRNQQLAVKLPNSAIQSP